jgi:predicted nucleotidyltransferase
MIDLEKKYMNEVKRILRKHVSDCEVRVYGSRVNGIAEKHSDLDLVVVGKTRIGWSKIEDLKEAFAESNLPITVDVLDWHAVSDSFRSVIEERYEIIQKKRRIT